MRWLITSALVVLLFRCVVAEEVTNTGQTLTPEQAQERIQYKNDYLSLDNVTSLTPEVAAILAKHEGDSLSLPDLKLLTPDVAAALSAYKGELSLNGLSQLSSDTAQELANHAGHLKLGGISSVSGDVALALAKHQGDLSMESLRELYSEPLARRLLLARNGYAVGGDGGLNPYGLTAISPEVAELLVIKEQDRDGLSLSELKSPSPEVLSVLARLTSPLTLGIPSVTPEMARILAGHAGSLQLPTAHKIEKETLAKLSQKEGGLDLYLTAITPDIAEVLSGFRGDLVLHSASLSEQVERVLAQSENRSLLIPELKEIRTADLARKLVESRAKSGYSDIGVHDSKQGWRLAVEEISPDVADQLKAFDGVLSFENCEKVSMEVAEILSECEGDVMLPNLRELTSPELARKLMAFPRNLSFELNEIGNFSGLCLPKVRSVSPEMARVLASGSVRVLMLDGLDTLSTESAAGLASFPGVLSLNKVVMLTPYAQAALGQGRASRIRLSSLLELTDPMLATKIVGVNQLEKVNVAVVAVLARRRDFNGPLDMPGYFPPFLSLNLKEITPEVAAALAENIGHWSAEYKLALPAVETLDAASASALAKCQVPLYLSGLKQLTPETAAAFTRNSEYIRLDGVEEISVETAKVLATKKAGKLDLRWKRKTPLRLPEQSADLLRNHKHITLPEDSRP